jgi:hypothetical protein
MIEFTVVQHFASRGSSHKGKGDARHMIDMVWLCLSPFPVGRRGYFTCSNVFYLPSRRLEEGRRGVSTL